MATFFLVTLPAHGHINPMMPISRMLVQRGHEVLWMTGKAFKERVEENGAVFYPFPKAYDPGETPLYDFWPELGKSKGMAQQRWWLKHVFLDSAPPLVEAIREVLKNRRIDALVGEATTFGVYFASQLTGVPSAMVSLIPLVMVSKDTPLPGLGLVPSKSIFGKAWNRFLSFSVGFVLGRDMDMYADRITRQLGLPYRRAPIVRDMWRFPALLMQASTPAFEYPRSDQPDTLRFIGPILLGRRQGFTPPAWWPDLTGDRPVILVNQGTVAGDLRNLVFPAIEALKDEDMIVVAVPVGERALKTMPKNVRAESFIPFDDLLPHVHAMVTNGGYGGAQLALAHGVPLVVAGATEDKMEVAARVEWSGAGVNLRQKQPSPSTIRKAVKKVLSDPAYRMNARRIQRDFARYDAPKRAAELLEQLVEGKGGFSRADA